MYSIVITVIAIYFSILDIEQIIRDQENIPLVIEVISDYQKASVLILDLSSFITMLTLYLSNKGYGEKASRFQSNYMELTRLLAEVQAYIIKCDFQKKRLSDLAESSPNENHNDDYIEYANRYASLLAQSENHEDVDYWKAVIYEDSDIKEKEAKVLLAKKDVNKANLIDMCKKVIVLLSVPLVILLLYCYSLINF